MHIKYWGDIAYLPNLMNTFVSGTYVAITCEVEVAVGCVLAKIYKIVESICPCIMLPSELYLEFGILAIFGQ